MKQIKGSEMKSLVAGTDRITLVDFSASWCGPCQMVHPVLEALSSEMADKVNFYKIDVDESPAEAGAMGIRGVPTMVVFHGGQEIDRGVGFRDKAELKRILEGLADRHLSRGTVR
jgi:thioredoxin 1